MSLSTVYGQTNTVASGNWNTSGNWSAGVPNGGSNTNVNHEMTLNAHLSFYAGTLTVNENVTDPVGGTNYNINFSNSGVLDVRATLTVGGALQLSNNAKLYVRSGDTLIIGYPGSTANSSFSNSTAILVEAGGVLIFNGNVSASNSSGITIDGELVINGNYTSSNSVTISGTGTMNTTGTITTHNSSTVFGSGNDCTTGPCSGNSLCASNTISANQTICTGQTPSTLTGSNPGSGYTYKWQKSTTSSTTGFSDISGTNSQNYSPGALNETTWYRRIVSKTGCISTSTAVKITVNTYASVSVSINASATVICSGNSVIFTATPVNGGTSPSYQWKRNGSNVGTNSSSYTSSTWTNGDVVTCVLTSNYSCISGSATATSNAITMTVHSGGNGWKGTTNSAWTTASNWCGGVPTASTDVIIYSDALNMPDVTTGTAVCRNLTIQSGATLNINGGTLNIKGNFNNNGTLNDNGTVVMSGTSSQTITGATAFNNLTINNSTGVILNSSATVNGILTLTSGALSSNGNLTIDLNTGCIAGTGNGSITGNIRVAKTAHSAKYHYISSPIMTGMTAADWNDDVTISLGPQYMNLYYYNETIASPVDTDGWTAITSLATPLSPLKGYALYFNGTTTIDQTGAYTHGSVPSNVVLTNTVSSDPNVDGWHLVGNPYPSTLDWDAASGWTRTGIDGAIYFWDPVNDRYASYAGGIGTNGGTRYIPSMQAFWVHVTTSGGTGTFGMNNNVRTTGSNPTLWKLATNSNFLKLEVKQGAYNDETIVRFMDKASNSFDNLLDAFKLKNEGNTPSLYTRIGSYDYSINSLADTTTEITIPLHLKVATSGSHSISAVNNDDFDRSYDIILKDQLTGIEHNLRDEDYIFTAEPADSTGRFLIAFKHSPVSAQPTNGSGISVWSYESSVYIENTSNATIGDVMIYNMLGKPVKTIYAADLSSGSYTLDLPGENGMYIVKVKTGEKIVTGKVLLR